MKGDEREEGRQTEKERKKGTSKRNNSRVEDLNQTEPWNAHEGKRGAYERACKEVWITVGKMLVERPNGSPWYPATS